MRMLPRCLECAKAKGITHLCSPRGFHQVITFSTQRPPPELGRDSTRPARSLLPSLPSAPLLRPSQETEPSQGLTQQGLGTTRELQGLESLVITLTRHICSERKGPFRRGGKGQETTCLPTFPAWLPRPPFQSHQGSSGQPKPRTRSRRTRTKLQFLHGSVD